VKGAAAFGAIAAVIVILAVAIVLLPHYECASAYPHWDQSCSWIILHLCEKEKT